MANHRAWFRKRAVVAAALLPFATADAQQQNIPRLGYVSPAGTRQGSSLMVLVGGQYLDGTNHAMVSGDGVQAEVVEYFRPIRQGQANGVRDKLKRLLDKKAQSQAQEAANAATPPGSGTAPGPDGKPAAPARPVPSRVKWTAQDEMQVTALRKKLAAALRGPAVPATAESALVQITVAPDAAIGRRELRLETPKGWTNPLVFCIGQLPEVSKEAPMEEVDEKLKAKPSAIPSAAPPEPPLAISLPCVANGQIPPGGADRYTFEARKGQRIVIAAETRTLIPYISDAVPGWFQAALTLRDEAGHELAYADHFRFDPEPVLLPAIPQDGRYTVEIRDALYRGREDFVYRLILGELPFITGIFPLGGKSGERTTVELSGVNLPSTTLQLDHREHAPGLYPFSVAASGTASNSVPFALEDLPESRENEPNGKPDSAQPVTLPVMINGRIDKPEDHDVFSFQGRAGQEIVAEITARRLRSPLDSVLTLTTASDQPVASNDDHEDKSSGLNTHHSDSYLRATLPADGKYLLRLADAQHQGGDAYAYRLRISQPRPDFELRLAPSRVLARAGGTVPVTVVALRKDGFSGPIDLALQGASEGFVLTGGPLPADKDQATLTLKVVYWTGKAGFPHLRVQGRATIAGQEIRRPAIPAEDMTQAFEYRHLVPASDLAMTVTGKVAPRVSIKLLGGSPVKLSLGQATRVKLGISPANYLDGARLDFGGKPPPGIDFETVETSGDDMELVLRCDPGKAKPGRGSLALVAASNEPPSPGAKPAPPLKLPAIPYEILKPR